MTPRDTTTAAMPSPSLHQFPPVMTIEQAAVRTGHDPAVLGAGEERGGPRTLNVLGTVLVLRDDLQAWLAGG